MTQRTPRYICTLNVDRKEVTVDGTPVYLAPKEREILEVLALAKGKVISRQELLAEVWGYEPDQIGAASGIDTRTVDQHVARLRVKFRAHKADGAIVTVPSSGYRGDGIELIDSSVKTGKVKNIKRVFGKNPGSLLTLFVSDLLPTVQKGSSLTVA